MESVIYTILIIYLVIQLFLTYAGLSFLVENFTKGKVQFRASTGIFFLPLFRFYGKNIHLLVSIGPKFDSANLRIDKLSFSISPIELWKGKILIKDLFIKKLVGNYTSRIPSKEKIKWLPPDGKVLLKNGHMIDSDLLIKDKTRFPAYNVHLKKLNLEGVNMDLGYPGHILFHTKKGSTEIGSGIVQTELYFPDHGFVKISGVTWGEFMNIESIPIQPLKSTVELHSEFKHKEHITNFRGVMGRRAKTRGAEPVPDSERFGFNFDLNWKENKLTIDLVLRKLIYKIFSGTLVDGVVTSTVSIIRDSIFAFLKSGQALEKMINQPPSNPNSKPIPNPVELEEEIAIAEEVQDKEIDL